MPIPIRPAVAALPAYVPGRPPVAAAGLTPYKLSSNENPYPPLPGVLAATEVAVARMNRYPDMANAELTAALRERLGVRSGQLAFGTGSVAVLYHLLQAICEPGATVVYAWRSFEAYPIAVQLTGATSVRVPLGSGAEHDLDAMAAAVDETTRVLLLCTPNNPTGPALRHDDVVSLVRRVPADVLVVLDEAYVEFVTDPAAVRSLELAAEFPNVAVLRTFSKAYGLAGFRVGYCIADEVVAAAVRATALPFGVSIAAQAAAVASLHAEPELMQRVSTLVDARESLATALRALGLAIPAAQGNFVWLPSGSRTAETAARFTEAGLMVRPYADGGPFDGIRITIGEPEANQRVVDVLAAMPAFD